MSNLHKMLLILLISMVTLMPSVTAGRTDTLVVQTKQGPIKGIAVPVFPSENDTVYQFRKIPYAVPPVGDLRFEKPVPHPTWTDTLDATEFGPSCMQVLFKNSVFVLPNTDLSEDCLFLNIYVPKNVTTTRKRSVMVWIHGGGFTQGAGMSYDGSYLANTGDVIVVTVNYRLGIFGFYTTGTDNAYGRGNYGLHDQISALTWIKNNIDAFGGNPKSVTIFGESAGSFSVSLLALIPSNKELFHRVIAESGVANSPISLTPSGPWMTTIVGKAANCTQRITDPSFLKCMRSHDATTLQNSYIVATSVPSSSDEIHFLSGFGPVLDMDLFHDTPINMLKGNSPSVVEFFQSLDIMAGNCKQEGALLFYYIPRNQRRFNVSVGIPTEVFADNIIKGLKDDFLRSNQRAADAVCTEYCVQNNMTEQSNKVLDMYSDYFYVVPTVENLILHSSNNNKNAKRYQYMFNKIIPKPYGSVKPEWFRGPPHAGDLVYLFGFQKLLLDNITVTAEDYVVSKQMMKYWTNFAKFGDPNSGSDLPTWRQFDENSRWYQQLDTEVISKHRYRNEQMVFWLEKIPEILANKSIDSTTKELPRPSSHNIPIPDSKNFAPRSCTLGYLFYIACLFICLSRLVNESA